MRCAHPASFPVLRATAVSCALTPYTEYVQLNGMHATAFMNALNNLRGSMDEVAKLLEEMRGEHDPLASHIFRARRHFRSMSDVKSGKRSERAVRMGWQTACELGFRGNVEEWSQLLTATPRR